MTSAVEHALDDVKSKYNELNRALSGLFPQFRDASEKLLNELIRKVQDLEQKEEIYRVRAENDKARIGRLEEENNLLKRDKQDHERLREVSERLNQKIDDYSRQIDTLNDQNRQLSDQYRSAERELTSLRLKNNDLTAELSRNVRDFEEFKDQFEIDKRTELANQANAHQQAMCATKESLQKALKKLRSDFDRQAKELREREIQVEQLTKEIKLMPHKVKAELMQRFQQPLIATTNLPPRVVHTPRHSTNRNPVRPLQRAIGGSSISSSSTSSLSAITNHRSSSAEPNRKRRL